MQDNVDIAEVDAELGTLTANTKRDIPESEDWEQQMYQDVIQLISDLKLAYKDKMELGDKAGDLQEIRNDLRDCQNENRQLQAQIKSGGGGGGADCAQCQNELNLTKRSLEQQKTLNNTLRSTIEKYEEKYGKLN